MPKKMVRESASVQSIKSSSPFLVAFITALICCLLASIASSILIYKISAEKIVELQSKNSELQVQIQQLNIQINNFKKKIDGLYEKITLMNEKLAAAKMETYSAQSDFRIIDERLHMVDGQLEDCKKGVVPKQPPSSEEGIRGDTGLPSTEPR